MCICWCVASINLKVCLRHRYVLNYWKLIFEIYIYSKFEIRHWWNSSFFLSLLSQKVLFQIKLKLRIDSAASGGDQRDLTHFMCFRWPPLEAALSISTISFFFFMFGWPCILIYAGYSESIYRLRISLAHPRDCHCSHVQWFPLSIEKPQTPFREIRLMFMFVPVR